MKLTLRACITGFLVAVIGLFAASPALAQDGPTLQVDPVAAAGENVVVVNGSGFAPELNGFLFPCAGVATAEEWIAASPEDKQAACDIGALTPVTTDGDGAFSAELTVDVPEAGLVMGMGDADQSVSTAVLITVGAAAADEAPAEEAPAEEAPAAEPAAAAESGDLAKTGVETPVLVGLGMALLGAGVGATRAGRRLGDR